MISQLSELLARCQSPAELSAASADFWHLLCGLFLAVFAVLSHFMAGRNKGFAAWRWLAAFGLLHSLYQWAEMLPGSLGDSGGFALFRLALLAASAVALAEFGRRGPAKPGSGKRSVGILAGMLVPAACGAVKGLSGLYSTVPFFLVTGSGFWASFALIRISRAALPARGALRLAGWSLAAYAATFCSSVVSTWFYGFGNTPISLSSNEPALAHPVRMVLSMVLAASLCHYFHATEHRRDADSGIVRRRSDRWLGPALLATTLLGGIATEITGALRDKDMRSILLSRTSLAAAALNPVRIKNLSGSEADLVSADYAMVKQRLMAMRSTDADCRFIYLAALRGDTVILLADSEPPASEDYSPPGQVYAEASPLLRQSLRTGQSVTEGPLPDRWGIWVSSFVPIYDPQTHQMIAVIGQDTDARDWHRSISVHRLAPIGVTFLIGLLEIVFFIVQQREYESARAIGLSERRYRQMFEKNPALMFLIDPGSGTIIDANPAACAYYEYSAEELRGKPLWRLNEGSREELQEALQQALSDREFRFSRRHKTRSGEVRDVEIRPGPVETKDGVVLYCVVHDVTARTRAEESLRNAKNAAESLNIQLEEAIGRANRLAVEAEVASQAKSQFLATMSHEIRTPLNGLIGLTSLLMDSGLTEPQRRLAEMLRTSGDALLTVINDVLDFSKIEAGKLELEKIEFDPAAPVMDTLKILGAHAADKGLHFSADLAPDIPSCVLGDPGCLRRILLNLAGNAIKFTAKGSVVIHCKIETETDRQITLRFDVTDTGIGISPLRIDRLFQPFSQLDSSTTRKYGGTGLGLVICKRLSEMMGGVIGVESRPGHGARFWFTVVFEKSAAAETAPMIPRSSADGNLQNLRILIVDDDEINRIVARGLIEQSGCKATCVAGGEEAIRTMETNSFDVVLMDVQMPEMDGFEAAASIRRREAELRRRRTPIIGLTAHIGKAEVDRSRMVGMDACLGKPIDPGPLMDTIRKVLAFSRSQGLSEEETSLPDASLDVFNAAELLDRIGGDATTFDKLISLFRVSAPRHFEAMQGALADGNLPRVRQEAHALRGAAANMSAAGAAAIARRIEEAAVNGDAAAIGPLLEQLQLELDRVHRALSRQSITVPPAFGNERTESCAY